MKSVFFYHRDTGVIKPLQIVASSDEAIALNTPADHIAIEGSFDSLSQKIDVATGVVVDYQPAAPSPDHVWNATTKRWVLKPEVIAKHAIIATARTGIAKLEASQHRAVREAAIGIEGACDRLRAIDSQIAELRKVL